ncbi:MAG: tyrosine-type recombinase/integrase [Rhizobiales bacterium]|nr:tyrosine-type recombinase/integrase [Hyphomicrobiales bacterium]
MSVYKHRDSPYWHFDFQRKGYRFSGSTDVPQHRPKREAEAVEKEERRKAEQLVAAAHESGRRPMTVAVACDRWWNEVGQHLAETDIETALHWLRDQLGPKTMLHAITADDVTKAIAERRTHMVKAGRTDKGVQLYRPIKARTVNRTVPMLLRRIMLRARDLWNVVIFKMPKWKPLMLKEVKRPINELTLAGEDAIDETERADYAALRRFITIMGLRAQEALLTWPQVDFDAGEIRIVGKGDKPAVLPLPKDAYAILWALRGHDPMWVFTFVAERTRKCGKTGKEYEKGKRYPITYWGLTSHRVRHWKKAGVTSHVHDLRHTTGRRVLRNTGNLKLVQQLLRHSDIGITAKLYADVLIEDIRDGLNATAKGLESRRKSRTAQPIKAKPLKG